MRDFEEVMTGIADSPEHRSRRRAVRRAVLAGGGGLAAGGVAVGGSVAALALGAGAAPAVAALAGGVVLLWLGGRGVAVYGRRRAAADRALFLDSLRHARTLDELRACGFIDPSEFMFDLMPVEEKLDVAPEPGVPLGPDCACDETDLAGELQGIEAMARKLGYGKSE